MPGKNKSKGDSKKKTFDVNQLDEVLDDNVALIIPKSNDDELNMSSDSDATDDSDYDNSSDESDVERFDAEEETANAKPKNKPVQRTSERHVVGSKSMKDVSVKEQIHQQALGSEYVKEKTPGRMVFKGVNFITAEDRAKMMNRVADEQMKEAYATNPTKKNKIKNVGLCVLYVVLAVIAIVLIYKLVMKFVNRKRVDMDGILKNKIDELPEVATSEYSDDDDNDDATGDETLDNKSDKQSENNPENKQQFTGGTTHELLDTRLAKPSMISSAEMDAMEKSLEVGKKRKKSKASQKNKPKASKSAKNMLKRDARGRFIARKKR